MQIPDFDGAEEGQVLFLMLAEIEQLHHELCSALQDNEVEKMVEESTHGSSAVNTFNSSQNGAQKRISVIWLSLVLLITLRMRTPHSTMNGSWTLYLISVVN